MTDNMYRTFDIVWLSGTSSLIRVCS